MLSRVMRNDSARASREGVIAGDAGWLAASGFVTGSAVAAAALTGGAGARFWRG